ncbi:MAG: exodeoxyribonuclease III [Proteobacteria bacterium]|nr:exodeoxyribonuclease III [Pseudomonadota bacterium]
MKLITWNVNSLRTRLERVLALLEQQQPDVLCLQETKVTDALFPHDAFAPLGYRAQVFGQPTYNGVALLSRCPLERVQHGFPGDPLPAEARLIAAELKGVRVINAYVVNGQTTGSEKYQRKLAWLDALLAWLRSTHDPTQQIALLGDFNIAPDDRDVHDPSVWQGEVLCSEPERARLRALLQWGFVDLLRQLDPREGVYSWWDYRAGAFPRNAGLRIDLILGTAALAARCRAVVIEREARKLTSGAGKPSDHAPVVAVFDEA